MPRGGIGNLPDTKCGIKSACLDNHVICGNSVAGCATQQSVDRPTTSKCYSESAITDLGSSGNEKQPPCSRWETTNVY